MRKSCFGWIKSLIVQAAGFDIVTYIIHMNHALRLIYNGFNHVAEKYRLAYPLERRIYQ